MAELQFLGKLSLGGHGDPQSVFNHIRKEEWGIVRRQRVIVATEGAGKGTVTVADYSGVTVTEGPLGLFAVKGSPHKFKIRIHLETNMVCRGVFGAFLNADRYPIILTNATTSTGGGQVYDFTIAQRGTNF